MANFHKNGQFVTNNYKKSIFNGVFTNYETFIPMYQTRVLLHTLLHRRFSICYHFKTFHVQMDHLKAILMKKKKNYPRISLISVLNHLLIIYIHLKLLFRMYLKQMFLLRCCSRKVLRVKFEKKASKII